MFVFVCKYTYNDNTNQIKTKQNILLALFFLLVYSFNVAFVRIFAAYTNKHYKYMEIRLKEICKAKGITQKDLANVLGVTEITLTRVNNGNTSLSLLQKIASALNVPIQELFTAPMVGAASISCPHCGKSFAVSVSVTRDATETAETAHRQIETK